MSAGRGSTTHTRRSRVRAAASLGLVLLAGCGAADQATTGASPPTGASSSPATGAAAEAPGAGTGPWASGEPKLVRCSSIASDQLVTSLVGTTAALYESSQETLGYTDCRYDDPDLTLVAEVQVWTGPQDASWEDDFDDVRQSFDPGPAPFEEALTFLDQWYVESGGTVVAVKNVESPVAAEELAQRAFTAAESS